jgi:hypothetical protein
MAPSVVPVDMTDSEAEGWERLAELENEVAHFSIAD